MSSEIDELLGEAFKYEHGKGVPTDPEKAIELYQQAAEQGHAESMFRIGWIYKTVTQLKDMRNAAEWFLKSANAGYPLAQCEVGWMHEHGIGFGKDYEQAVHWYLKAADQGVANAQSALGLLYRQGQGVEKNLSTAAKWYKKAAEQGEANAQNALGSMYEVGDGVPEDMGKAIEWFKKAADQNESNAQYNLGRLHEIGQGVKQDYSEALYWYRKSADQKNFCAENSLGYMYQYGLGVKRDLQEAIMWYMKAANQGHKSAQASVNALLQVIIQQSPDVYRKLFTPKTGGTFTIASNMGRTALPPKIEPLTEKEADLMVRRCINVAHNRSESIVELETFENEEDPEGALKKLEEKSPEEYSNAAKYARNNHIMNLQIELEDMKAKFEMALSVLSEQKETIKQLQEFKEKHQEFLNEQHRKTKQQDQIWTNETLKQFYVTLLSNLTRYVLACTVVSSGKVERAEDNVDKVLNVAADKDSMFWSVVTSAIGVVLPNVGSAVDLAVSFVNVVSMVAGAAYSHREEKKMKNVADVFFSVGAIETICEGTARKLTLRYRRQISLLDSKSVDALAKCAMKRLLCALKGGRPELRALSSGSASTTDIVPFGTKQGPPTEYVIEYLCICVGNVSRNGLPSWAVSLFSSTKLELNQEKAAASSEKINTMKRWTDHGVFQLSGLEIEDPESGLETSCVKKCAKYLNRNPKMTRDFSQPDIYGYRLCSNVEIQIYKKHMGNNLVELSPTNNSSITIEIEMQDIHPVWDDIGEGTEGALYVRADYAENPNEPTIKEGESVRFVKMIEDSSVEVMNRKGEIFKVPTDCVEVVAQWSSSRVAKWIQEHHNLQQIMGSRVDEYSELFEDNEIDGKELLRLTDEILVKLGVSALGHRNKIMDARDDLILAGLQVQPLSKPKEKGSSNSCCVVM